MPLIDITQRSQEADIPAADGIRTQNPTKRRPQTHALDRAATLDGQSQ